MYVACISRYSNPAGTQGNDREFFTRPPRPPPRRCRASTLVQTCSVSFTGEFSPNFDLKKSEPDLYKGFFMEQKRSKNPPLPNSPDFQEFLKIKSPDFHAKFQ